jgi:hypothetical protein
METGHLHPYASMYSQCPVFIYGLLNVASGCVYDFDNNKGNVYFYSLRSTKDHFLCSVLLEIFASNDSEGNYIVNKNDSLCKFGIKWKIKHSSVHTLRFFVDVDMFYKFAHNFL